MNDQTPAAQPAPAPLLDEDDARARILAGIVPLPAGSVPLRAARGLFAARAELATEPLPAFDNSAMDGYALAWPDPSRPLPSGTRLRVGPTEQPAGADRRLRVGPGGAVRIFTGGPLPAGAGAVVMQEDTARDGDELTLLDSVEPGENIRRAGGDLARGQRLFDAGEILTAARLGLLASQGRAEISVARPPRVAVLATGDELRPAGQPLAPGEIYESNGTLLAALAESLHARVTVLEPARDERADLDAKLAAGLHDHDALIVAGGVSVGERDLVKERLAAAGVRLDLWRVRIQPGKPFLYGRAPGDGGAHVFGLPGNPVSAFVTFLLFVRPALRRLMGAGDAYLRLPAFPGTAAVALVNRGNRPHYLRGAFDLENGAFAPVGAQQSHALFALSRSQALVRVAPGEAIPAGGTVRVFWLGA